MTARRPPGAGRPDGGSISVELVASVPLLVACTILLIEGLLAVTAVNIATRAARDGARVAASGGDGRAAAAAQVPAWLQLQGVDLGGPTCSGACATVHVGVPLGLPGLVTLTHVPVTRSSDFPV